MRLTPKQNPNGNGWSVRFLHPLLTKVVARSLGHDELAALAACRDAEALFAMPEVLQDPNSPRLLAYERMTTAEIPRFGLSSLPTWTPGYRVCATNAAGFFRREPFARGEMLLVSLLTLP